MDAPMSAWRSEEHTSELQSHRDLHSFPTRRSSDLIDRVCKAGEHAVIACSALKRAYRDILVHGRTDVRMVFLNGTQELIASRLAQRKGHFMPPDLLASQFNTLEPPDGSENPITVSIDASVDAIVDDIVRQLNLTPA